MKILETIQLILMAGLVIGVPSAVAYRPPGREFSVMFALEMAGIVAAIFILLIALNILLARWFRAK